MPHPHYRHVPIYDPRAGEDFVPPIRPAGAARQDLTPDPGEEPLPTPHAADAYVYSEAAPGPRTAPGAPWPGDWPRWAREMVEAARGTLLAAAMAAFRVGVGTSARQVLGRDVGRRSAMIRNSGATTITIGGDPSVTAGAGFDLTTGSVYVVGHTAAVWAASDAAGGLVDVLTEYTPTDARQTTYHPATPAVVEVAEIVEVVPG